jgi:hypothetical protein
VLTAFLVAITEHLEFVEGKFIGREEGFFMVFVFTFPVICTKQLSIEAAGSGREHVLHTTDS